MGDPRSEDPYTLDDLVEHEKKNTRLVAVLFVAAVIVIGGKQLLTGSGFSFDRGADPAPVTSGDR